MEILVKPSGNALCIYSDAIPLSAIGEIEITRASHVEPDSVGLWMADLSPVYTGRRPYLGAVRETSRRHRGGGQLVTKKLATQVSLMD